MRRLAGTAVGLVLCGLSIVSVSGFTSVPAAPSAGEIVRVPNGCPNLPPARATRQIDRVAHVVPRETAPTAMDHLAHIPDVRGVLADARGILGGFAIVSQVTLPSSGIEVEIRSDGPLAVDAAELDALARLPLEHHATFSDARVAALMGCYHERVMVERELDGTRLRLYVPSDHAACFRRGRLSRVEDGGGFAATCDSAGITLPGIPLRLELFGMEIASFTNEATIIVSGAAVEVERAEERLAYHLLHEFVHHYDNSMGLLPWEEPMSNYERRAYYVERALRHRLGDAGGPPLGLRYPEDGGS